MNPLFSPSDVDAVRRRYPIEGARGLSADLGRTPSSIRKKASELGIYKNGFGPRVVHTWTDAEDAYIRDHWRDVIAHRMTAEAVAQHLGIPHNQVRFRAATLGVARPHPGRRPWTAAEEEYLCAHRHLGLCALVQRFQKKGWSRSKGALGGRLAKLNQRTRGENDEVYSARGLAALLGMDDTTVLIWIRKGLMKATPRTEGKNLCGGPKEWVIKPQHVRSFLQEHTAHVDFKRADKYWLVDLLTGTSE